jgi:hypothetical protein
VRKCFQEEMVEKAFEVAKMGVEGERVRSVG